ncbi:MAG: glycosyltransferase [Nitrospira sp.]|nr:glycosyltransferase [Nitrospira sp.]
MNSKTSGPAPLNGIHVLILTSGHDVTDHRIYHKQAKTLSQLGAAVTIVGKTERGSPTDIQILPVDAASSRLTRFLLMPWMCLWKARWQQADIIHVHDAEMLLIVIPAKLWWWGSKFVYDVHEDFSSLLLIRDWLPQKVRPMVKAAVQLIEKALASCADAIVGVTAPLAKKFTNVDKVTVYNFPSAQFFAGASLVVVPARERKFDLVHVGTLTRQRALFLADTIRSFHAMRRDARSLIVGLTPEHRALMETRVPENCMLLEKVQHHAIPSLVGDCKVGIDVHPWLGPHLKVALPVKVCEYMACGCAVVSSGMPVLDEILAGPETESLERSIKILRSVDPTEYAREVLALVESIDQGADPGGRLLQFAQAHMNWNTEADKLSSLYLRLTGRSCAM